MNDFINVKKIADNERKLRLTYYYEDNSSRNFYFSTKQEYQNKMAEFTPKFVLINGIWYNPDKFETITHDGLCLNIFFYDKTEMKKTFDKESEIEEVFEKVEDSFVSVDGTWYNGKQLEKVSNDDNCKGITYCWMNQKLITVYFQDETEYEEACNKIEEIEEEVNKVEDVDFTPSKTDPSKSKVPIEKGSTVELKCDTPNVIIYYTMDGTTPTIESMRYIEPIVVEKDVTIKAIAVKQCSVDVISVDYEVHLPKVKNPEFIPSEGEVEVGSEIKINCETEDATVHYTTDGSKPTSKSDIYKDPIIVKEKTTIKAVGMKKEYDNSDIVEATYTVPEKPKCSTPIFNPDETEVKKGTEIVITASPSDANIYYTIDGSDPSPDNSELYKDPIVIEKDLTLKAIAVKKEWDNSDIKSADYTIVESKDEKGEDK